jgi:hypothetical protein
LKRARAQADFDIINGGSNQEFLAYFTRSGTDNNQGASIMNDIRWWEIGTAAGLIPQYGVVLGPALGLIPIILGNFSPPDHSPDGAQPHIWANQVCVNSNNGGRGTAELFVEVQLYGNEGQPPTDYTFNVNLRSWLSAISSGVYVPRVNDLLYSTSLSFAVNWTVPEQ